MMLKKKLSTLYRMINDKEERVMIHCAAGIHRTGSMAYTLLRIDGCDKFKAYESLKEMRL